MDVARPVGMLTTIVQVLEGKSVMKDATSLMAL
jgi:hypothetical protein